VSAQVYDPLFQNVFSLLRTEEVRNFQETEDCWRFEWINVVLSNVRQKRIEILQAVSKKQPIFFVGP